MARKETPQPLLSLKEDFKESLDHASNMGIILIQQVEAAIELGAVKESVAALLKKHCDAFRNALVSQE